MKIKNNNRPFNKLVDLLEIEMENKHKKFYDRQKAYKLVSTKIGLNKSTRWNDRNKLK